MTEERCKKIYEMTDADARARAIDALPPKEYMEYMDYAGKAGERKQAQSEAKAAASASESKASASASGAEQIKLTEHDLEQLYDMDFNARREALSKMDSSAVQLYHEYEAFRDSRLKGVKKRKKWKEWSRWRKGWRIVSFIVHMVSMWYLYQTIYWFIRLEMWTRFDSLRNIVLYSVAYNPTDPLYFVLAFVASLVLWYLVATFDE